MPSQYVKTDNNCETMAGPHLPSFRLLLPLLLSSTQVHNFKAWIADVLIKIHSFLQEGATAAIQTKTDPVNEQKIFYTHKKYAFMMAEVLERRNNGMVTVYDVTVQKISWPKFSKDCNYC